MLQKEIQECLNAPRTEEKLRQLVALTAEVPLRDVGILFSWKDILDERRQEEFEVSIADALTSYFKAQTSPSDIRKLNYFWEIVNKVTCKC